MSTKYPKPVAQRIAIDADRILVGNTFSVAFQRTLRVPDDGTAYPLPPGLGRLPVRLVEPSDQRSRRTAIVPLRRREAVWLGFDSSRSRPHAVLVGLGHINAVTGERWSSELTDHPQNYLVSPPQMWLDGFKVAGDRVRQFVATPLGTGTTVESQLTGEDEGTVHLVVYEAQPGYVVDPSPAASARRRRAPAGTLGLGAGGQLRQRLYPDPHGLDTWASRDGTGIEIRLVTAEDFEAFTGETPPPTPIDAATYTAHGFPWFEIYDEPSDLPPTEAMEEVRSIGELEGNAQDASVNIPKAHINPAAPRPVAKRRT